MSLGIIIDLVDAVPVDTGITVTYRSVMGCLLYTSGGRLSKEDYDELLRRKSVADITFYLKHQTAYSEVLSDVHEATIHRGQLENLCLLYTSRCV